MNQSIWADPAPEHEKVVSSPPAPPTTSDDSVKSSNSVPETSAPPPLDLTSDAFAPTGMQQSDLFDDVEPVESMRIRDDDDLFADDFTPAPQPVVEPVQPTPTPAHANEGESGAPQATGRGRGRGRGRGPLEGRGSSDRAGRAREGRGSESAPRRGGNRLQPNQEPSAPSIVQENVPSGPRKETVASVRGDRQATGGVRKPKLTEAELAEKMAEIQIKNASLTAAHARAEADAASFAEREQHAKQVSEQRRKEERRDRQQMMGEREKNRQRKLKATEGREWDAEKQEDDFRKGGRFDKKGGFAGDKEDYSDGREYLYHEPRGGGTVERGRGGGRAGRGGRPPTQAALPKQEDFPALPTTAREAKIASTAKDQPIDSDLMKVSGKSWADQVEAVPMTPKE